MPGTGSGAPFNPGGSGLDADRTGGVSPGKKAYGYGLTTLFALLAIVANLIGSNLVAVFYMAYRLVLDPAALANPADMLVMLAGSGTVMGLSVLVGALSSVLVLLLVIWLRRGPAVLDYLRLRVGAWHLDRGALVWLAQALCWSVFLFGLVFATDYILTEIIKIPEVEFMRMMACAPDPLGLLMLAAVFIGPVFEEILVRGFWLRSLEGRRLSLVIPAGFLLPNLVWALLHAMQYNPYLLAQIFLMGLVLSAMRWHLRSLWPPILLHVANNALALFSSQHAELECGSAALLQLLFF